MPQAYIYICKCREHMHWNGRAQMCFCTSMFARNDAGPCRPRACAADSRDHANTCSTNIFNPDWTISFEPIGISSHPISIACHQTRSRQCRPNFEQFHHFNGHTLLMLNIWRFCILPCVHHATRMCLSFNFSFSAYHFSL